MKNIRLIRNELTRPNVVKRDDLKLIKGILNEWISSCGVDVDKTFYLIDYRVIGGKLKLIVLWKHGFKLMFFDTSRRWDTRQKVSSYYEWTFPSQWMGTLRSFCEACDMKGRVEDEFVWSVYHALFRFKEG